MVRLIALRLLESYFRHRWSYLLPIVAVTAIGVLFVLTKKPEYLSIGTVYVQRGSLLTSLTGGTDGGSMWVTPSQATVSEINELLRTDSFVRSAIQRTNLEEHMDEGPVIVGETIDEFRESINLSSDGDNLLSITARHEDPRITQQVAEATLETFIQWKLNAELKDSENALQFFEKLGEPYEAELKRAQEQLRNFLVAHPEPVRGNRSETEQQTLLELQFALNQAQERVYDVMEKRENAKLAQARAESQIRQAYAQIDAPQLPLRPVAGLKAQAVLILPFMMVGVFLSIVGVIGGAILDRSLRFPIDVRHGLDLPVLAMIPFSSITSQKRSRDLMVIEFNRKNRSNNRSLMLNAPPNLVSTMPDERKVITIDSPGHTPENQPASSQHLDQSV